MRSMQTCGLAVTLFLPFLAHADSFCITNADTINWYYSVRAQEGSGNSNFVLKPGESHKFSVNDPGKYHLCGSKGPMTTDCPQRSELADFPRC